MPLQPGTKTAPNAEHKTKPQTGDIAINPDGILYANTISTVGSNAFFYSVDIKALQANGAADATIIANTNPPLQLSFSCDGSTLWGQRWGGSCFFQGGEAVATSLLLETPPLCAGFGERIEAASALKFTAMRASINPNKFHRVQTDPHQPENN
jgi:hypothetical protein